MLPNIICFYPHTLKYNAISYSKVLDSTISFSFRKLHSKDFRFRIELRSNPPGMARNVRAYVKNCDKCKMVKSSNQILRPPMGDQSVTNRPFERLYCDFLGPYPLTKEKNTCIFICKRFCFLPNRNFSYFWCSQNHS